MTDLQKIRDLRAQIRAVIGLRDGAPITDEMLSATMASIAEVWTLRIYNSPEKHTNLKVVDLFQKISLEIQELFIKQSKEMLPHATTYGFFHRQEPKKP